jgi:hypothetical protein
MSAPSVVCEGHLYLAAGAGVENLDLQPHGARSRFNVSQRRLGSCIGRVDEHGDTNGPGRSREGGGAEIFILQQSNTKSNRTLLQSILTRLQLPPNFASLDKLHVPFVFLTNLE